jgi:hypothetical protein
LYHDRAHAGTAEQEARVTSMGGLGELYAALQAQAAAVTELEGRLGGIAELHRDQARERDAGAIP